MGNERRTPPDGLRFDNSFRMIVTSRFKHTVQVWCANHNTNVSELTRQLLGEHIGIDPVTGQKVRK